MNFHVTIDFPDDVGNAECVWTEDALRQLIRGYARRGIKAIHWMDYGGIDEGMWERNSGFDRGGKSSRFVGNIPHPLRVVCDEAHKSGMLVYAIVKIHDLAFGMPYEHSTVPLGTGPQPPTGLPHIGGEGTTAHRWLRQHPDRRVCLHPSLQGDHQPDVPIRTLRLWHETEALSEVPEIEIFTSADNGSYQAYRGPVERFVSAKERRPPLFAPAPEKAFGEPGTFTCIEFNGLDISAPFLCLKPAGPFDLANAVAALVEVEDADGQALPFTCGLITIGGTPPSWRPDVGIAFDCGRKLEPGPGRGAGSARQSMGRIRIDFRQYEFLGLARGRNKHLTGMAELAYPEVRTWFFAMIENALDDGADGVDFRQNSHTECLDWENYGFSPPIIEDFKERYGVDISTEPFNRAAWRRLRGEYHTLFLEEAAAVVHAREKELVVHLMNIMDRPAEQFCFLEVFWDWRGWLCSGIVDRVTLKETYEWAAVDECKRLGIPTILTSKQWFPQLQGIEFLDFACNNGFEVFNIYESAGVTRLRVDGTIEFTNADLWDKVDEIINR